MTDGLKAVAGDSLRAILARFTGGPVTAVMTGVAITLVVQWSSATVLMTIGFVSAGLLTFAQSVGVIFGANLGTTSTGWLVALLGLRFSISAVALPLVGIGALARLLTRGRTASMGMVLAGFGLIFVGIDYLQAGMDSFSEHFDPAIFPAETVTGRLVLVGIGIIMTVVLQSSSATVTTTLTALHSGTILPEQAAALLDELVAEARPWFEQEEIPADARLLQVSLDMRYEGQNFELRRKKPVGGKDSKQ